MKAAKLMMTAPWTSLATEAPAVIPAPSGLHVVKMPSAELYCTDLDVNAQNVSLESLISLARLTPNAQAQLLKRNPQERSVPPMLTVTHPCTATAASATPPVGTPLSVTPMKNVLQEVTRAPALASTSL